MKEAAFHRVPQLDLRVLKRARELIERGWTQKWFAKTKLGRNCAVNSPYAICWCTSGAISRACIDIKHHDSVDNLIQNRLSGDVG